jgi:mannose-1-phosphate guanylyltransferase / mannose-6-phosphate isomerase
MGQIMNLPVIPVVLCVGSGTRLWQLSRDSYPKQFLLLLDEKSLLQQTKQRGGAELLVSIQRC